MIPVPSYQILEFLQWLQLRRETEQLASLDSKTLRHLALQFLKSDDINLHPESAIGGTLEFVLKVFQTCPMISGPNLEAQMQHFSGCGRCIEYIDDRRLFRHLYTQPLHRFLQYFLLRCRTSGLERYTEEIGMLGGHGRRELRDMEDSTAAFHFYELIHDIGPRLYEEFLSFLHATPADLIKNYERWRTDTFGTERKPLEWTEAPREQAEEGAQPITPKEQPSQAAWRLADSVHLLLNGSFYDKTIASGQDLCRYIHLLGGGLDNLGQSLEFVGWLARRYPSVSLTGDIPGDELSELVQEFCEEVGYSNVRSFAKSVQGWFKGEASQGLLNRIVRLALPGGRSGARRAAASNPFDRYRQVKVHGLFLFLWQGDFPKFVKDYWKDLNSLTGDIMDIYYSEQDLKGRVSGHNVLEDLRALDRPSVEVPSLVLWGNSLQEAQTIPLWHLSHEEIYRAVDMVVRGLARDMELNTITPMVIQWAKERATEHGASVEYVLTQVTVEDGGAVNVGDINNINNSGIIATDHANLQNVNVVNQVSDQRMLSSEEINVLRELVPRLVNNAHPDLPQSVALQAAAQISEVVESGVDAEKQAAALANWHDWFIHIGEKSRNALSLVADIAAIGLPIAKALGLPGI